MAWFRPHDADESDPRLRAVGALRVLGPAALAGAAIVTFVPWATWVVFAFGWMLFPAAGQFVGGVAEVGRRAFAAMSPATLTAASTLLADAAEATRTAAALQRLGHGAATIPPGQARHDAERVAAAATRLATAPADPVTHRVVRGAFVVPTADLLAGFGRLAATASPEVRPELDRVAADFPRLAEKLDGVVAELRPEGGEPHVPALPAERPPVVD